jgi:hypothetical protein
MMSCFAFAAVPAVIVLGVDLDDEAAIARDAGNPRLDGRHGFSTQMWIACRLASALTCAVHCSVLAHATELASADAQGPNACLVITLATRHRNATGQRHVLFERVVRPAATKSAAVVIAEEWNCGKGAVGFYGVNGPRYTAGGSFHLLTSNQGWAAQLKSGAP